MPRIQIERDEDRLYVYNVACIRCGHYTLKRAFGVLKCDTCHAYRVENPYANVDDLRDHTDVPRGVKVPRRPAETTLDIEGELVRDYLIYVGAAAVIAAFIVWWTWR